MKYIAYVLFVAAAIHAFGCVVGHTPARLLMSAVIAGVGFALLFVSKKKAPKN